MRPLYKRTLLLLGTLIIVLLATALLYFSERSDDRPRLAQDKAITYRQANLAFEERLRGAFPIGSSESAIVKELKAEGFNHAPGTTVAVFDRMGFPCRHTWTVRWKASADALTEIMPRYEEICL